MKKLKAKKIKPKTDNWDDIPKHVVDVRKIKKGEIRGTREERMKTLAKSKSRRRPKRYPGQGSGR